MALRYKSLLEFLLTFFMASFLMGCGGEGDSQTDKAGETQTAIKEVKNLTLFVHGFDKEGYQAEGVFGDEHPDDALEKFQELGDYPVANNTKIINLIKATTYYGDESPKYYTAQDMQDLKRVTEQWGGGIPRYALIVAKYAKYLMKQEKVDRINIVSGSMGSLVTRWMIEKDVEGLASQQQIAKWYSLEGVIIGNYAADRIEYIEQFYGSNALDSIDIEHMSSDWISDNLSNSTGEASSPFYKHILLGQQASTDDDLNSGLLTKLLFLNGQFSANDGTQRVKDCRFDSITDNVRYNNLPPTFTLIHKNHLSIKDHMGAWANVMTFLNTNKRVTLTLVDAKVEDIQESIAWHNKKAEIIFASNVYSPKIEEDWGITEAITENTREGATLAVHSYIEEGEEKVLNQFVLDQLVAANETHLNIQFQVEEIDNDAKYGVYETYQKDYDLIDMTEVKVPLKDGVYGYSGEHWSFHVKVKINTYPTNE